MVRTLQSEKLSLLSNIDHMEKQNRQLQEAVESLNAQVQYLTQILFIHFMQNAAIPSVER